MADDQDEPDAHLRGEQVFAQHEGDLLAGDVGGIAHRHHDRGERKGDEQPRQQRWA